MPKWLRFLMRRMRRRREMTQFLEIRFDSHRFEFRVTEIVAVDRNGLAVDLIGPSGEIAETRPTGARVYGRIAF